MLDALIDKTTGDIVEIRRGWSTWTELEINGPSLCVVGLVDDALAARMYVLGLASIVAPYTVADGLRVLWSWVVPDIAAMRPIYNFTELEAR